MTEPQPVVDLAAQGRSLLATARAASSGRAATSVFAAPGLRAVLIALREGAALSEHTAPGAATLHCLLGRARLWSGEREWLLDEHGYAAVPPEVHAVDALTDCVVLLTVAAGRAPEPVEVGLAARPD